MGTPRFFSINVGLSSAFAFVVLTTSFFISLVFFDNLGGIMRDDLGRRIHDILGVGLSKLDARAHAALTNRAQEAGAAYRGIKKTLQEIRDGATGIRFVYTMRRVGPTNYRFVVDAEEKEADLSHLGDPVPAVDILAFAEGTNRIHVAGEFATDKWGTWLTGYAKLPAADGKSVDYLCLDISAQSILQQERRALMDIVRVDALITLLFIGLGILIARRIAKPLSLLEKDMLSIKDFVLDANVDIRSRFREIMNMKLAEDNMKVGLQSFRKYVPADLVSQLIRLNKEARLGGEKQELTILFSDIADFTAVSERLDPEELAMFMAEYFEGLTAIILKHGGTVDKYIGDAIMAFWGAPSSLEDHAHHACLAVLECGRFLDALNAGYRAAGKPELATRFGLNTGEVIVGNFGYKDRFNYTVLGDNVNLASRLEAINKLYGTRAIVSESTHALVRDRIACRKLDTVAVKGKRTGIAIYELLAPVDGLTLEQTAFLGLFHHGMEFYLGRQWSQAIEAMEKAQRLVPDDVPCAIIVKRCREFLVKPPADDWQGVIVLREK